MKAKEVVQKFFDLFTLPSGPDIDNHSYPSHKAPMPKQGRRRI